MSPQGHAALFAALCDRADRTGRWAKGKGWFVLQRLPIRAEEEGTCLPHGSPRIFKNNIQVWFTGKTGERLKHLICPYPPRLLQNAQAIAANLPGPPPAFLAFQPSFFSLRQKRSCELFENMLRVSCLGDRSLINHSFPVLDLSFKRSNVNSVETLMPWNQCEGMVWGCTAARGNKGWTRKMGKGWQEDNLKQQQQ